ncbi:COG4315 family predicted lipoprotein [Rhodococcus xishaensis]|uniref:Lipoprotein with Yx(FWY)xxD motif n=1 Tax=Rhodococcus xishaensis TaxID=2487364 RepID=A0A438ANB8_9NOCA|nr:hypothetical protein [Rhodococcus xishaensis]RVW00197.1 hypothetical protein EGT50_16365 [Rhodococcus xishaensis]
MGRMLAISFTALAAGAALVGCTNNETTEEAPATMTATMTTTAPATAPAAGPALSTAQTDLGEVVVNVDGMTVYAFDMDTPGTDASACDAACQEIWPPVMSDNPQPEVSGVAGTIATIPGPQGGNQVTVNGMPVYLFSGDAGPGSVAGQGVQGLWWALNPAGEKIMTEPGG